VILMEVQSVTKKMTLADRWWGARNAWLLATVVASTFVVTYVATVRIKPLFSPDSSFYAAMALWFGGTSKEEAVRQVIEMRHRQGWSTPQLTIDRMFGWGLVQPRVVLPALSAPFVKIWGIEGLAVVPGLAMAALIGVLTWLLVRRWGWVAGAATVVLIMCSWRVMFYGSAMLTDSLSAAVGRPDPGGRLAVPKAAWLAPGGVDGRPDRHLRLHPAGDARPGWGFRDRLARRGHAAPPAQRLGGACSRRSRSRPWPFSCCRTGSSRRSPSSTR